MKLTGETDSVEEKALGSRHPFQIFTLLLCLFIGIPLLVGDARPGSVDALLPDWAGDIWGLLLVAGATTALVSIYLKNRTVGLLLEQVGLVTVGSATLFYAACVLAVARTQGAVAAIFTLGFGMSCMWRWVQLQKLLNTAMRSEVDDG